MLRQPREGIRAVAGADYEDLKAALVENVFPPLSG